MPAVALEMAEFRRPLQTAHVLPALVNRIVVLPEEPLRTAVLIWRLRCRLDVPEARWRSAALLFVAPQRTPPHSLRQWFRHPFSWLYSYALTHLGQRF